MRFYDFWPRRSVCSNLGVFAATSENVQQSWSVCSNFRAGAVSKMNEFYALCLRRSVCSNRGACAATPELVQKGRTVCSSKKIIKAPRPPPYPLYFMLLPNIIPPKRWPRYEVGSSK